MFYLDPIRYFYFNIINKVVIFVFKLLSSINILYSFQATNEFNLIFVGIFISNIIDIYFFKNYTFYKILSGNLITFLF